MPDFRNCLRHIYVLELAWTILTSNIMWRDLGSSINDVTQFIIIFDTPSPQYCHALVLPLKPNVIYGRPQILVLNGLRGWRWKCVHSDPSEHTLFAKEPFDSSYFLRDQFYLVLKLFSRAGFFITLVQKFKKKKNIARYIVVIILSHLLGYFFTSPYV